MPQSLYKLDIKIPTSVEETVEIELISDLSF